MSTTISSNDSTTVAISAGASSTSDIVPKSVITICVLVAGFLLGVLIAKLVNYCYNRADVPDNASDISEHTKGLLRIQLALLKFGKSGGGAGPDGGGDSEEAKRQQQATVLSMWKMKAMNKAAQRVQELEVQAATGDGVEIVNETAGNKKGKAGGGPGAGKGGAAGATAAAKKGGGDAGAVKAGAFAKPNKPVAKPRKLFPNSVAGVAPAASNSGTTATTATESPPAPAVGVAKATAGSSVRAARSQTPTGRGGKSSQGKPGGQGSEPVSPKSKESTA